MVDTLVKNVTLEDLSFKEAIAAVEGNIAIKHWPFFCKTKKLSTFILRQQASKLNWKIVSKYQRLSEAAIEEFKSLVYWPYIVQYQNVSEEFKEKYKHLILTEENTNNEIDEEIVENLNTDEHIPLKQEKSKKNTVLHEALVWIEKNENYFEFKNITISNNRRYLNVKIKKRLRNKIKKEFKLYKDFIKIVNINDIEKPKQEIILPDFQIITDFSDVPAKTLKIEPVKITRSTQYTGLTSEALALEIVHFLKNSNNHMNKIATIANHFEVTEDSVLKSVKGLSKISIVTDYKKNVFLSLPHKKNQTKPTPRPAPPIKNDLANELLVAFNNFDECIRKNASAILQKSGPSYKDISMHKEKLRHVLNHFINKIK